MKYVSKSLTPRQREAILLVGQGYSNREIALHMGITEGTVIHYLMRASRRLNIEPYQTRGDARFLASEKIKAIEEETSRRILHRSYAPCCLGGI